MTNDYSAFLQRLHGYERLEPLAKPRTGAKLLGVRELVARVGNPQLGLNIVHVAGTNGKGLTSAMVAALLQGAGHRTGCYSSPHVLDVRERITLGGELIAPEAFARAGHQVLDQADRMRHRVHLSYFDLLTAIGLLAIRQAGCQWAVLETGLGGSADATNITPKRLAILTRIGLDHLHVLGNSLRGIAEEKLGIVRRGVPVVLARQAEALAPWMRQRLAELGAPVWEPQEAAALLPTELKGPRRDCAATALSAAALLLGNPAPVDARTRVAQALAVTLPGRLDWRGPQQVKGRVVGAAKGFPQVVLDGGHNPDAMNALADALDERGPRGYTLLFSLQADKLIPELGPPLARLFAGAGRRITLTPQTIRAPQAQHLRDYLAKLPGGDARFAPLEWAATPRAALELALDDPSGRPAPLVAAGSFWTLGDLMQELEPEA